MMIYWRPGLRVWWRSDGEVQLGQDPPTFMFGLSTAEHALLDALAGADPQLDCWTIAMRLGWNRDRFAEFTARLPAHALVDAPTLQATPALRYWSVVETTGAEHSTSRFGSEVIIDGVTPLGMSVVDAMCRAGIDTVYLADTAPVAPHDVHPGGFLTDDVGLPRAQAAMHRLRPRHPMARIHVGPHPAYRFETAPPNLSAAVTPETGSIRGALYSPSLRQAHPVEEPHVEGVDLAVVIGNGALPTRRVLPYERAETPILPVVVRELDVVIGPLLSPSGPCLRCVHLTLTDEDPRWPALATQMASETNPGIDPIVVELAAAVAAHQIVAFADGRPTALVGASLHVDGIHPVPRITKWSVHPDCGCQVEHLAA